MDLSRSTFYPLPIGKPNSHKQADLCPQERDRSQTTPSMPHPILSQQPFTLAQVHTTFVGTATLTAILLRKFCVDSFSALLQRLGVKRPTIRLTFLNHSQTGLTVNDMLPKLSKPPILPAGRCPAINVSSTLRLTYYPFHLATNARQRTTVRRVCTQSSKPRNLDPVPRPITTPSLLTR